MMNNDFDLANELRSAFATFEEATHYLEDVCARLKVNHLSYWLVDSIDGMPDQVTWITAYDPSYMRAFTWQTTRRWVKIAVLKPPLQKTRFLTG